MTAQKIVGIFLLGIVLLLGCRASISKEDNPFVGHWALFLDYGAGTSAGWLEVRQEKDYLDGDLLWRWGSVEPAASMLMSDADLIVTRCWNRIREKDEAGQAVRTHTLTSWYQFHVQDPDHLSGKAYLPDDEGNSYEYTEFSARRLPPMPAQPDPSKFKFGQDIVLFNGVDLTGWTLVDSASVNGFSVKDGILINDPVQQQGKPHIQYGNLCTEQVFKDFKLGIQVNVPVGSNSGVYLRGLYEVQVLDSYGKPLDSHNMGAVYSRITPAVAAEKPAGEWQELQMILCDRHITVQLNGVLIIDNQPVPGVTGGALTADVSQPGPVFLQGDHGKVMFRDIVLTPIVK